jgi:hypothetical protein
MSSSLFSSMRSKLSRKEPTCPFPSQMTDSWDQRQVSSAVLMDIVGDLGYPGNGPSKPLPQSPYQIPHQTFYRIDTSMKNTAPPIPPPRLSPKEDNIAFKAAFSGGFREPVPKRHESRAPSRYVPKTPIQYPLMSKEPLPRTSKLPVLTGLVPMRPISEIYVCDDYDPYVPSFTPSYKMSPPAFNYYSSIQKQLHSPHSEPLSPASSLNSLESMESYRFSPTTPTPLPQMTAPLRWESIVVGRSGTPVAPARYSLSPSSFNKLSLAPSDMPVSPVSPRADFEEFKHFCIHFQNTQYKASYPYQKLNSRSKSPKSYLFHSICYQLGIKYNPHFKVHYLNELGEKIRIRNELDLRRSLDFYYLFVESC